MYSSLAAGDRFPSNEMPSEVRRRLKTLPSASGYPAYLRVFSSIPADPFGSGDDDEDMLFAQDISPSEGRVQQR